MDNVNFDAKTDWKLNDTVMPADANRWEKGIDDTAKLANHLNETKLDTSKADKQFKDKADITLKNTNFLANCLIGAKNGLLNYTVGQKANYTIVGSPTISPDGFVSNFDKDNFVSAEMAGITADKNLLVELKIKTPAAWSGSQVLFIAYQAQDKLCGLTLNVQSGVLHAALSSNGTSWNLVSGVSTGYSVPVNATLKMRVYFTGYQYVIAVQEAGQTAWKIIWYVNNKTPLNPLNLVKFGVPPDGTNPFQGAISVKDFKVQGNGKKIFNGVNALPEKNCVINNGVASGFNYSDGSLLVLEDSDFVPTKSLDLCVKFKLSTLTNYKMIMNSLLRYSLGVRVNAQGLIEVYMSSNGTSWGVVAWNTGITITAGKFYWFRLLWDGKQYIPFISTDGVNFTAGTGLYNNTAISSIKTNWVFGFEPGAGNSMTAADEIDLTGSYVKVDGALISGGANFYNSGATVENGVAGGFTNEKVLTSVQTLTAPKKNFVYTFKLHTPSVWTARTRQFFMGTPQGNRLLFYISNAGFPYLYMMTGTGTDWNIAGGWEFRSNGNQFKVPNDSDYWIRLVWDGKGYIPQVSSDGLTFTSGWRNVQSACHQDLAVLLGDRMKGAGEMFDGQIDLKETSLKVDGTFKFKGANLLTMNEAKVIGGRLVMPTGSQNMNGAIYPIAAPETAANNWDIVMNVHTPSSADIGKTMLILGNANTKGIRFYLSETNVCAAISHSLIIKGTEAILPDKDYWVRFIFDGTGYYLYHLIDNGDFTLENLPAASDFVADGAKWANTTDNYAKQMFAFGLSWENDTQWRGSIDLTKCQLKRNGEVFWAYNGKDGDNIELENPVSEVVYNGKDEQNKFTLDNPSGMWAYNGRDNFNTTMNGGIIWQEEDPVTGTITLKAGTEFLLQTGEENGFMKTVVFANTADKNVQIPYAQGGSYAAYIKADGTIETVLKPVYKASPEKYGALLCFFTLQNYVISGVQEKAPTELLKREDLYQVMPRTVHNAMPDFSAYIDFTNGEFTAPEDGYIFLIATTGGDGNKYQVDINGVNFANHNTGSYNWGGSYMFPIAKGQTATIYTTGPARFVPCLSNANDI